MKIEWTSESDEPVSFRFRIKCLNWISQWIVIEFESKRKAVIWIVKTKTCLRRGRYMQMQREERVNFAYKKNLKGNANYFKILIINYIL